MLTQLSRHPAVSAEDLVDLLAECHQRIRHFIALARQVGLRQGVPTHQMIQACSDVERYFTQALPLHVADEEESIEPRLRGVSPTVDGVLDAVAHQHRQHDADLKALLDAVSTLRENPHDPTVRSQVATTSTALEARLEEHLLLEERVIFPAIRALRSPETQTSIILELRKRRHDSRSQLRPLEFTHGEIEP